MTNEEVKEKYGCRYCGAKPGEPCIDIWGNPQEIHQVRISAAKESKRGEYKRAA